MLPVTFEKEPGVEVGLINGMTPGSKEEWYFAVALWSFKLEFYYQVPIRGGRRLAGGRILDFLVFTPFPTPEPVMGSYWHSGKKADDDRLMLALLRDYYGVEPVPLWEHELTSVKQAIETTREKLHL